MRAFLYRLQKRKKVPKSISKRKILFFCLLTTIFMISVITYVCIGGTLRRHGVLRLNSLALSNYSTTGNSSFPRRLAEEDDDDDGEDICPSDPEVEEEVKSQRRLVTVKAHVQTNFFSKKVKPAREIFLEHLESREKLRTAETRNEDELQEKDKEFRDAVNALLESLRLQVNNFDVLIMEKKKLIELTQKAKKSTRHLDGGLRWSTQQKAEVEAMIKILRDLQKREADGENLYKEWMEEPEMQEDEPTEEDWKKFVRSLSESKCRLNPSGFWKTKKKNFGNVSVSGIQAFLKREVGKWPNDHCAPLIERLRKYLRKDDLDEEIWHDLTPGEREQKIQEIMEIIKDFSYATARRIAGDDLLRYKFDPEKAALEYLEKIQNESLYEEAIENINKAINFLSSKVQGIPRDLSSITNYKKDIKKLSRPLIDRLQEAEVFFQKEFPDYNTSEAIQNKLREIREKAKKSEKDSYGAEALLLFRGRAIEYFSSEEEDSE